MKAISKIQRMMAGAFALAAMGCANTSTTADTAKDTEAENATEWEITVHETISLDTVLTLGDSHRYAVADTAAVNRELSGKSIAYAWTLPIDGYATIAAYNPTPLYTDRVAITKENVSSPFGDNRQVAFRLSDPKEWESITGSHIGKCLALFVNGQLMAAPQLNTPITSGNCAVMIPATEIATFLPDLPVDEAATAD